MVSTVPLRAPRGRGVLDGADPQQRRKGKPSELLPRSKHHGERLKAVRRLLAPRATCSRSVRPSAAEVE